VALSHRDCGGAVDAHRICEKCGARLGPRDVRAERVHATT
jgi:ribosomal protein L32